VTLSLEVGTYKWHATHRLVMIHVSMKFHEIIFIHLEVVVRTKKCIFDLRPLLVTLTIGSYKWHTTHRLIMMHVSMKFHEILKEKGIFDL